MNKFTPEQINWYKEYEQVRSYGLYNMFSNDARTATGLTKDQYTFVMKNYTELRLAYYDQK